jgi:hypothetical protein
MHFIRIALDISGNYVAITMTHDAHESFRDDDDVVFRGPERRRAFLVKLPRDE